MTTANTVPLNNAFLEVLQELGGGATQADLHKAMIDLVGSVRSVGKGGKLTLTINVSMAKGQTETLLISEDVKIVEPKPDRATTVLFADDNNRLSRRHPNQPKLPTMADEAKPPADIHQFSRPVAVNERPAVPDNVNPSTGELHE